MPRSNFKSSLNEYCQVMRLSAPVYTLESKEGPAHEPVFSYRCVVSNLSTISGPNPTRKDAENEAAKLMLDEITNMDIEQGEAQDFDENHHESFVDENHSIVLENIVKKLNNKPKNPDGDYYVIDMESWSDENIPFHPQKIFISSENFSEKLKEHINVHFTASATISTIIYCTKLAPIAEMENRYIYIVGKNHLYTDMLHEISSKVKLL